MPISLVVRDGLGGFLREADYAFDGPILRLRQKDSNCTLLAGVDPIGDTMFNRFQLPLVKVEVDHVLTWDDLTDEQRLGLRAVADMCDFALAAPQRYLWFVGD